MHPCDPSTALRMLLVQWWWWCVWMFFLVVLHPLGTPVLTLGVAEVAWIAAECVLLQMVPLLIAIGWCLKRPLAAERFGSYLFVWVPIGFAGDVLVFRGSGMHLAEGDFLGLAREHLPRLIAFVSWGMLVPILGFAIYVVVGLAFSKLWSRWVVKHPLPLRVCWFATILSIVSVASGAWLWFSQGRDETRAMMQAHATRHPANLLGLYGSVPISVAGQSDSDQHSVEPIRAFRFDRSRFVEDVSSRMSQMRMNVVMERPAATGASERPDVLIIILESLRSEMLHPGIMPHTFAAARSGWWLRQHYSGGNATSLGIFSLVSGLESIWFYRSEVRFAPAMNRLFRQAGYELGFFAGHDDWNAFQMDAFLSPRQFDRYDIESMDWLASDRRSIAKAKQFLRKPESPATRSPRLAVLFLYSTHAPFAVADVQARDQPSASASYPIPFPESWRNSVWNRYRNAARSLDAELAEVLRSDAVVALVGDHGESFLDDGTVGHGTKLSRVQTRTAAMIRGPRLSHREIDERTTHMDVLPTLLAAAGIEVSRPDQFDGLDLATATQAELRARVFSISNSVGRDIILVPSAGRRSNAVFGTGVRFSLLDETMVPRGVLDEQGNWNGPPDNELLRDWVERLGR